MTRIVGPTGSRRRRRFLLVPLLFTTALALLLVVGAGAQALAVGTSPQDNGLFQLDGNTLPTTCAPAIPAPNAGEGDDWAALFTVGGSKPCGSDAFTFVNDGVGSADKTYWSAGGSKDAYDP